jgi:hypothetical protein
MNKKYEYKVIERTTLGGAEDIFLRCKLCHYQTF